MAACLRVRWASSPFLFVEEYEQFVQKYFSSMRYGTSGNLSCMCSTMMCMITPGRFTKSFLHTLQVYTSMLDLSFEEMLPVGDVCMDGREASVLATTSFCGVSGSR